MAHAEELLNKLNSRLSEVESILKEESNNLHNLQTQVFDLRESVLGPLQDLRDKIETFLSNINETAPQKSDARPAGTSILALPFSPGTSILQAVEDGDIETLFHLLETGGNVRQRNELGHTLLHIAAKRGHDRAIVVLLGFGADVDAMGPLRRRPVHVAAVAGHLGVVQRLLSAGANANLKDSDNRTPLMLAAQRGHSQIVSLLLSHKVSTSDSDCNGDTALITAAKGGHLNTVEVMACEGLVDETNEKKTAMVHAAKIGAWDIVKLLCKKGASPDIYNDITHSPLSIAAEKGDADFVRCLLDCGEKPAFSEEEMKIALSRAKDLAVVWAFEDALPGRVLEKIGEGAMRLAAQEGRLDTMIALLDTGVHIDGVNKEHGGTALIYACKFGQVDCVKMLLQRGADHSIRHRCGGTALHMAFQEGYEEIVRVLLQAGADTSVRNKSGKTPLELAKKTNVKI